MLWHILVVGGLAKKGVFRCLKWDSGKMQIEMAEFADSFPIQRCPFLDYASLIAAQLPPS